MYGFLVYIALNTFSEFFFVYFSTGYSSYNDKRHFFNSQLKLFFLFFRQILFSANRNELSTQYTWLIFFYQSLAFVKWHFLWYCFVKNDSQSFLCLFSSQQVVYKRRTVFFLELWKYIFTWPPSDIFYQSTRYYPSVNVYTI